jgi:hypothetical protein
VTSLSEDEDDELPLFECLTKAIEINDELLMAAGLPAYDRAISPLAFTPFLVFQIVGTERSRVILYQKHNDSYQVFRDTSRLQGHQFAFMLSNADLLPSELPQSIH